MGPLGQAMGPLQLTRLTIQGSEVRLSTAAQRAGATYRIHANPVLYGTGPSGERLPLDTTRSSLTFAGSSGQGTAQEVLDSAAKNMKQEIAGP